MTIPAVRELREHHHANATLDFSLPPRPDAAELIRAALSVDLSAGAFRVYTAAVLALPAGTAWSVAQIADAANLSHHASRMLIAQLVNAGLLTARRHGTRDEHGAAKIVKVYTLAGGVR